MAVTEVIDSAAGRSGDGGARRRFGVVQAVFCVAVLAAALAVASYTPVDADVLDGGVDSALRNWMGDLGARLSCALFICCGASAYLFLGMLLVAVFRMLLPVRGHWIRFFCSTFLMMLGAMLLFAFAPETFVDLTDRLGLGHAGAARQAMPGGVIGQFLAAPQVDDLQLPEGLLRRYIGPVGTMLLGSVLLLGGAAVIYFADFHRLLMARILRGEPSEPQDAGAPEAASAGSGAPPEPPADAHRDGLLALAKQAVSRIAPGRAAVIGREADAGADAGDGAEEDPVRQSVQPPAVRPVPDAAPADDPERPEPEIAEPARTVPARISAAKPDAAKHEDGVPDTYTLPPITMLSKGAEATGENIEAIVRCRETLQRTLENFKVDGKVVNHISGPRVTRYEIQLAPGVKVDKVVNLESNIAMELEAQSVRILAPIPGRNVVGVEAPNSRAEAVFMRSIMESKQWKETTAEIPIVLGRDVSGKPIILDLAKAPHLLIAGATGSGKSVCMNTLIMSLLFRFRPDELRLILVDPKVVEHEAYRTLPHLITPVVNDATKVPIALRWAVSEMEKRYKILARAGVKNLRGYNARVLPPEPVLDDDGLPIPDKLPVLVAIVDELADIMMTDARKDVETSIARIAQKGRAAGIHIVIATQRPSREIVTGVIRANLPTKIAFMVGKRVDSQVILDQNGAETLLGKGDMLYLPPGSAGLERIQGAMVDDNDIKKVVEFVSAQAPQKFNEQVVAEGDGAKDAEAAAEGGGSDAGGDVGGEDPSVAAIVRKYLRPGDSENVRRALEIIVGERKASTSYFQRRLGIGYNSAAELTDLFEKRGIIGPSSAGGNKREILIFDDIIDDPQDGGDTKE